MQLLKKIPFHILLLVIFFCLHGVAENYGALKASEVFYTGLSVLVFALIIFLTVWLFAKNIRLAGLVSFFILLWFLFFGVIHDLIKSTAGLKYISSYTIIIPLLLLATIAWIFFIRKKKGSWEKFTLYLNILTLIYCVTDLGRLAYKSATAKHQEVDVQFNYAAVTQKPDIFFILFDGYPGQQSLSDSFHFSNTAIKQFLEDDSFHFLPVYANYNRTQFSMSSVFNMKYVQQDYNPAHLTEKDYLRRESEINNGAVFHILEQAGYRIANNSIFSIHNESGADNENGFVLSHNLLLTDKIFINRFNRDAKGSSPGWLQKLPFIRDQSPETQRKANVETIDNFYKLSVAKKNTQPVFSYSHFYMPHGPYFFDSTGSETNASFFEDWTNKKNFLSYLSYTNRQMERMVTDVVKNHPDAVIIVMSDHGFRNYETDEVNVPAMYNSICAVRLPGGYSFRDYPHSNVNFFPWLFNTIMAQRLPYLKDSIIPLKN